MIYFITNNSRHNIVPISEITVVSEEEGINFLDEALSKETKVGYDFETNGLDPYINCPLLLGLEVCENTYIIDLTKDDSKDIDYKELEQRYKNVPQKSFNNLGKVNKFFNCISLEPLRHHFEREDLLWIAHAAKFDIKMLYLNFGILPRFGRTYCTMIAEQILMQGLHEDSEAPAGLQFGFNSLIATIQRRTRVDISTYTKEERNDFIGMNPLSCQFNNSHLLYLSRDTKHLKPIFEEQFKLCVKNGQQLAFKVECSNIVIYALKELVSVDLDVELVKKNIKENEETAYSKELELDKWIKDNRVKLPTELRLLLTGGKYDNSRIKNRELSQAFLNFDTGITETVALKEIDHRRNTVNWSSTDEVLFIFAVFSGELPTKKDTYDIPILEDNIIYKVENGHTKDLKTKYKVVERWAYEQYRDKGYKVITEKKGYKIKSDKGNEFTTNMDALVKMISEKPNHPMIDFIHLLKDYREAIADINNRGQNLIDMVNYVSNGIHTCYRQRDGRNGRVQSGNTKENYFNSQNMKNDESEDNKYKRPFYLKNRKWCGTDWSGIELAILAARSGETKLIELAKEDMHSKIATEYWRIIFANRANAAMIEGNNEAYKKYDNLSKTFVVSKKEHKMLRNHKISFPVFYGAKPKKIMACIQNNIEETKEVFLTDAKIIYNWFQSYFPKAMTWLEEVANFVNYNGYLPIHPRTNTLIHFPMIKEDIDNCLRFGQEYNPRDYYHPKEKGDDARNLIISGTQREALGEAQYEIHKRLLEQGIDIGIKENSEFIWLYDIHDELNYSPADINKQVTFTNDLGQSEQVTIPQFVEKVMCEVMNRYLSNGVRAGASTSINNFWSK